VFNSTNNEKAMGRVFTLVSDLSFESIQKKSFVDMPATLPVVQFLLSKAGVTNRPYYIQVQDPFTGQSSRFYSEIKIHFGLPANQRGVHMSRIEECLDDISTKPGLSLIAWMEELSDELLARQKLSECSVNLDVHYEKVTSKNLSQVSSNEIIKLHSAIERTEEKVNICCGMTVPFINACPCTQRWGMREFYSQLIDDGYNPAEAEAIVRKAPLQAHTNLGRASLKIWSDKVTYPRLYNLLDRAVPIVRELLKGMDEHSVVRHVHQQGQFCEDNARQIVQEVVKELDGVIEDCTMVEIEVEVAESVHFHNLNVEVKSTFGDLKKNLKST
jgi:GTP cyclohydrolase FolE2